MMDNKSFTLIELLLVISIIGLLTLVIVSGLRSTTDRARIARTLQYQASLHRSIGNHLVGWWNFNEGTPGTCQGGADVCDISGYNNHGIMYGSTPKAERWVEGIPGTEGNTLYFNGSDDYINLGATNNIVKEDSSWTISAWFNANLIESGGSANRIVTLMRTTGNSTAASILVGLNSRARLLYSRADGSQTYLDALTDASTNKWYYFVAVYNGTVYKSYIDGEFKNDATDTFYGFSSGTARIGTYSATTYNFNGFIDDVRIYNTALTSKEIERIYTETKNKYLAEDN